MTAGTDPQHPTTTHDEDLAAWQQSDRLVTIKLLKISAVGLILIIILFLGLMWALSGFGADGADIVGLAS